MDQHLRAAAIEFFKRTRAWMIWLDPIAALNNTREYTIVVPAETFINRIEAVTVGGTPLNVNSYRYAPAQSQTTNMGYDEAYGSSLSTLMLSNFYTAGTQILVQASLVPKRDSTGIPDALFEKYADDICEGAKARLLILPKQEWTDAASAGIAKSIFDNLVAERAAEAWRGNASSRNRTVASHF
jgi:hypothetical protein